MRARPPYRPARTGRAAAVAVSLGAAAALVAGCSIITEVRGRPTTTIPVTTLPTTTTTLPPTTLPATTTTSTIALPYPLPRVGECRPAASDETLASLVDPRPAIGCGGPHGSETAAVLTNALVAVEEHPGSRKDMPEGLADRAEQDCGRAVDAYLGVSPRGARGRAASRLVAAWFVPPPEEWDLGARWVRCEAVVAAVPGETDTFAGAMRGALAGDVVPLPLVACFTRSLARTRCDAAHAYEAIVEAVIPDDEERPDDDTLEAARRDQCDPATAAAVGVAGLAEQPELRTELIAPTARRWAAGDRTATCMVTAVDGRDLNDSVRSIAGTPPPLAPAPTTTTTKG